MAVSLKLVPIEQELRQSYLDYAMSVIVSRALPEVRDGLKPVQRRILYALDQLGLRANTPYKKCARIVGEVLGKFHPHGDASVYEALVRLAQDFSMRYPLVDGQGNFGSIDDDPPAAMRYTEARLAAIALEMLADIEKDTVDFSPNFDDSLTEPIVLPTILPNLLVNGSSGIAVGMATNIAPHNLGEICDALIFLIDNPDAPPEALWGIVKGPDFPTGGIIAGEKGLREAFATGRGRLVLRGKAEVEEGPRGRPIILISQLPYQTNKAELVERIATLIRDRRLEGAQGVRDESDRHGIRVVVELKREAQAEKILNNLYKLTPLRSAFHVNMLALVDGQPRLLNLKDALQHHIDFRKEVITRRSRYELKQAQERAHLLEGLRLALSRLDEVIATIRRSRTAEQARQELMASFSLSQLQAQAILDMPLRRLAALERQRIEEEYTEIVRQIAYLEDLLANPRKVFFLIQEEARALKQKYGDARRTQIGPEEEEKGEEDYIPHELMVVSLGPKYIKRMGLEALRSQHRAGMGVALTAREEGGRLAVADTHQRLLFFSDAGKVYSLKVYQLPPEASRTARGTLAVNILALSAQEKITALTLLPLEAPAPWLTLVTRNGAIKKTPLSAFGNIRSSGLRAMRLRAGQEIVAGVVADEEMLLVSRRGKAIRFSMAPLRPASRGAGGVRGMALDPQDEVVAALPVTPGALLLVVTSLGFGKVVAVDRFPRQGRGGKGVYALRPSAKTGPIAGAAVVFPSQEVLVLSARGMGLRTTVNEVPVQGRGSRGVAILALESGDQVVALYPFLRPRP